MDADCKKILVVDDSALMRRVLCDIINSDKRFQVVTKAEDGLEALELLAKERYDGVVLDINMPRMNGLELLAALKKDGISANVLIASTDSTEGAMVTLEALELGALDFIQKPGSTMECRGEEFTTHFLDLLYAVCCSHCVADKPKAQTAIPNGLPGRTPGEISGSRNGISETPKRGTFHPVTDRTGKRGGKVVAIASSTGGPKALQSVIPRLPGNLDAPVLLVQHMPKGFTASLAERLNGLSRLTVKEAQEGESLEKGVVYIAMGGKHLRLVSDSRGGHAIRYTDEPAREGVKPSANYMYESLAGTGFSDIACVVLTGMGADGTEGIRNLKKKKSLFVITQDPESCVVYGMPKNVVNAGLSDQEVPLQEIASRIAEYIGVR